MSLNRSLVFVSMLIVAVIGLLSACTSPTAPATTPPAQTTPPATTPSTSVTPTVSDGPQYGGVLKIHRRETPDTPIGDVQSIGPRTNESVANIIFQPLCYYNAKGEFVPMLATALDAAEDQSYMDVTLREGVKFHDGTVLNAEAAKWNLDRYLEVKKFKDPQWKSIEVLSEYKFRVNLNYWTNTLYYGLGYQFMSSPAGFLENGVEWAGEHPAGTGPFKFESYERDVKMTLTKFEDYWEEGKPYLDGIELIYLPDVMTTQMAFEKGDLDLVYLFLGKQAAEIRDMGYPYNKLPSPLCPVHGLIPSNAKPESPLSNLKVRQAVALAFDREEICSALGYGWLSPIQQIAPVGSAAYIPELEENVSHDVEQAKQLLEEAGFPEGFDTKLIIPPQWANAELASALQASLARINIKAEIEFPEAGKFAEYRWTPAGWGEGLIFQEFINWPVYTMHPDIYWNRDGSMPMFFDNKYPDGWEELLDKLLRTTEIDKALVQEFNQMFYDEKTCIPLYQLQMVTFFQHDVHTNFMDFSFKTDWLPANAWIEQ